MKEKIHPKAVPAKIICGCGSVAMTLSTKPEIRVDVCSNCHPFYTGTQRLIDTEGRVDKFIRRYSKKQRA
ncbi:MAG: 50S ribosomal protein L31 [Deinococcus sp.]|nr:50S ribosomal protein L31 [Deinococcus sp.]